jgi:anti-anti-sigma regulatory factor
MEDYIQIKKKYLFFREDAKNLTKSIIKKSKKNKLKNIFLDFSSVDFMSRSFVDEFLNSIQELNRKNIKTQSIHLRPDLHKFINCVAATKSKIQTQLESSKL